MKRKFSIFLNVVLFVACVCSLAFGVYSAKTAKLNVSGNVGFTAHNCKVDVYGYIYGHSTAPNEEPKGQEDADKLKKSDSSEVTSTNPLLINGTTEELSFGTVYFSDLDNVTTRPNDIIIVLTITNVSEYFPVLLEDTSVGAYSNYSVVCSNPLHVLYTDETDKTTTLTYTLSAVQNAEGNYDNITTPVSISIGIYFSKIDADAVGKTTDGWEVDSSGNLTAVPTKAQNNNSDMLIIPASVTDGTTSTGVSSIGAGSSAPTNLSAYTKVVILKGATSIGNKAFYNDSSLTNIAIPSSATSMGGSAFYKCSSLTSITIPEGVTSIGDATFSYCDSLMTVELPESLEFVGRYGFSYCPKLIGITIPKLTELDSWGGVFNGCDFKYMIVNPENPYYDSRNNCNAIIETSSNKLLYGCRNSIIPDDITSIAVYAFTKCSSLTSITIPSSVTSIGGNAFKGCTGLTDVIFADTSKTWTANGTELTVTDPATNATNLKGQYYRYSWTKNS